MRSRAVVMSIIAMTSGTLVALLVLVCGTMTVSATQMGASAFIAANPYNTMAKELDTRSKELDMYAESLETKEQMLHSEVQWIPMMLGALIALLLGTATFFGVHLYREHREYKLFHKRV